VKILVVTIFLLIALNCWAKPPKGRSEAEYYVAAYATHYGVPLEFVRAIVDQESGWQPCVVSSKGAVGLMQLMPDTARKLGVVNRCDIRQNISGGVRHLAALMRQFHGDLRLVAAAYYAGSRSVAVQGLEYRNADVVCYVASVRRKTEFERKTMYLPKGRTR